MAIKEQRKRQKRKQNKGHKDVLRTKCTETCLTWGTEQHREVHSGWLHRSLCENDVVRSTASRTATKKSPCIIHSFDFHSPRGFCYKLYILKLVWAQRQQCLTKNSFTILRKNSKYPFEYHGNSCTAIGSTGVFHLRYQLPVCLVIF